VVGGVGGRYDVGGHSAGVDLSELHTMAKRDPDSQAKQRIVGEVDSSAILEWWLLVGTALGMASVKAREAHFDLVRCVAGSDMFLSSNGPMRQTCQTSFPPPSPQSPINTVAAYPADINGTAYPPV